MKSATKWILFFAVQVNNYKISRANLFILLSRIVITTQFVIAISQSKEQSFFFRGGWGVWLLWSCVQFSPKLQFSFISFVFVFIRLFCFFFFVFFFWLSSNHCHCETTPLQEDIITHTSGVTSHCIVLHPVSSRAPPTSGLCVQFIYHSWLVDYRNI